MRLIDADMLKDSLLETFENAVAWYEETKMERAEQAVVTFAECLLRLKEQPTAEPKAGGGIKMSDSYGTYHCCSRCGREGARGWKYCPNCGAKMEGEEDGI